MWQERKFSCGAEVRVKEWYSDCLKAVQERRTHCPLRYLKFGGLLEVIM